MFSRIKGQDMERGRAQFPSFKDIEEKNGKQGEIQA
jgi:hypothetical protein